MNARKAISVLGCASATPATPTAALSQTTTELWRWCRLRPRAVKAMPSAAGSTEIDKRLGYNTPQSIISMGNVEKPAAKTKASTVVVILWPATAWTR